VRTTWRFEPANPEPSKKQDEKVQTTKTQIEKNPQEEKHHRNASKKGASKDRIGLPIPILSESSTPGLRGGGKNPERWVRKSSKPERSERGGHTADQISYHISHKKAGAECTELTQLQESRLA